MKKILFALFAAVQLLFMASCSDDDIRFGIPSVDDQMHLTPSVSELTLSQDLGSQTALSFSWGPAQNRGEGIKYNYYFKMDLEGSNFENSIDKIHIEDGQNSVSFTHKQLNSYLKMWGVMPGMSSVVQGEIIAEAVGGDKYLKPEVSIANVSLTGYDIQPRPLYIFPADGGEAIELNELLSETQYQYIGVLTAGAYKVAKSSDADAVVEFEADKTTYYVLDVNVPDGSYKLTAPTPTINKLYMVGDACDAGWNIGEALEMKQDAVNKFQFTYTGNLYAGELKFPVERAPGWDCDFIMAATADQSIRDGKGVLRNQPDTKWRLYASDAGLYNITVDTYNMTVTFEKPKNAVVPDDVPYKGVWVCGDATSAGWTTPFRLAFTYDASQPKGTFVLDTHLTAGELKFPLSNASGFECDYLMPQIVDADNHAPLSERNVEFVAGGNPDRKWVVKSSEEGDYRITLNVLDMTVKFSRK